MGVPKFFRFISERYPCLSELVKDYQIPEFDNLYLDMNGIIHNCSHPNDEDPHFRITEEKIFKDIFHYIEVLFRMIKPQKLFFMAIDGVAPRAKMNQQRGRRFRSAADAAQAEAEVIKRGETLPTEARFDSNCITPGTVFMARLHEQLKYFVVDKISNDPLWQKCKVILSGHETPGEGEHKIMDYIRYIRAQPGYDPNTRHCLYGLDADLIMLGLCTHEPHFSLLREEVKFGGKSTKRITVPEEITFFLLHLSLLREYLDLEFASIKSKLQKMDFDIEKIIDDWVLMGFLVGNDFIPHLPNLHIAEGALPILYKTYMEVLPTMDGYINEGGKLNLKRFETFLAKLGEQDMVNFEQVRDDLMYLESKTDRKRRNLGKDLEEWEGEDADDECTIFEALEPEISKGHNDSGLQALLKSADELCIDDDSEEISDEEEFMNFKKDYYKQKLEYADVTPEVLKDQAEGFVRAVQWNLNYYYNGCCSWSWFYPHHYSPYISDIKGFTDLDIKFDMGKPFLPYEQLLAVLPAASKQLLPECYHPLMTDENSLIIDYYPKEFECDLNGKKQAWEAVVKIPFIDEKRLLEAMSYYNDKVTTEEKERNIHGPMLIYMYTPRNNGPYPAPCYFPEIPKNHTEVTTMLYSDILVPKEKLIKGAYPGAHMDTYYPGFPTMKHLKYTGELQKVRVRVFEQPSRNESMVVRIIPDAKFSGEQIPVELLGTSVYIGWPHLKEAKVIAIANNQKKFICMGGPGQYNATDLKEDDLKQFHMSITGVTDFYKTRNAINFGETKVLVYVKELIGRKFTFNSNGKLVLDKQFAQAVSYYPLQVVVFNIRAHDPHNNVIKDVETIFPKNSICFTLTNPHYGSQGVIQDSAQVAKTGRIKISISVLEEPDTSKIREMHDNILGKYKPVHSVANPLCISNVLFSKITGTIIVKTNEATDAKKINIGLDFKLNRKNKETPGYTKKINNYWYYTDKSADLVAEYMDNFPEVFEYLSRNTNNDDIIYNKLFPEDSNERLAELQQWLKSLPTHSLEKIPCNSISLEPEVVEELEKIIDTFKSGNVKKVTMHVKPSFLYRPEVQTGTLEPDPKTETEILDRIVNVRHGYTVPFGFKGTVTGIRKSTTNADRDTMYEVVFDKPFRDGLKLNCSENRGYMLPKTAFINISYGQRLLIAKTGKPGELIAKAEASNTNQNQNNSYFNNLIRPEPSFQQQQWYPQKPFQQQTPLLYMPQNPPPLNQANSAFAHFSSINTQRNQLMSRTENHPNNAQRRLENGSNNLSHNNISKKLSPDFQKDSVAQFFNNHLQMDAGRQQSSSRENNDLTKFGDSTKQNLQDFNNTDSKDLQNNDKQELFKSQDTKELYGKQYEKLSKPDDSRNQKENPDNWRQQNNAYAKLSFDQNQQQRDIGQEKNKSVNYFLPNFADKRENASQVPENDKTLNNKPESSSNQHPVRSQTVNTDFLKNILGIGKSEDKQQNENKTIENKENVVINNVTEENKSSNVSFDMLAQVANTPASIRLLTYYQSNLLGLPRYQYFPVENKLIQAQVTLNDGKIMYGEPAKTRDEASENVAAIVLDALLKRGKSIEQITQKQNNIPPPPVNWVHTDNKQKDKKNDKPEQKSKASNSEATAVLNNSFVPLQAVKSHINKANSSGSSKQPDNYSKNSASSTENDVVGNERRKSEHTNQAQKSTTGTHNKPKKGRKTRIAANFLNKN